MLKQVVHIQCVSFIAVLNAARMSRRMQAFCSVKLPRCVGLALSSLIAVVKCDVGVAQVARYCG